MCRKMRVWLASASASAPEVGSDGMHEEARSTTGKQDRSEASRNDALAPVGGDVYLATPASASGS